MAAASVSGEFFPKKGRSRFVLFALVFLWKADRNAWSGKAGAQGRHEEAFIQQGSEKQLCHFAGTNKLQEQQPQARIHPGL